ncbi:MAG: alpha-amylase, partial [Bacteroidota bacterium]|nr:alpha-amylase [Bacteroidota bacterium]
FTIPGIPIIYYGDEIGMPGAGDPDNRRMMSFENLGPKQEALKSQIGKLATLRKNSMALLYGDLQMIHLDKTEKGQFAFQRKYLDETVFVGFNKSNKEMSVVVNKRKITIPPNAYKIYEYHE